MRRINVLDIETANKIAAGEVVEKPSSVVKELVENSIDAKAKNIIIEIEEGGTSFIRIIDDGIGIHKDDLEKAFLPHATSKIKNSDDIFSIMTLGFRGEALPSIAAVSKVTLKTKTEDMEFGEEITIEGGKIINKSSCGTNLGTTIEVRDIFFNVPARKKFLKSNTREASIISDIINRLSLANPNISFKLFSSGKKILQTFGRGELKDSIRAVYGKTITDNILYFETIKEDIKIFGYIGKEEISRGSRNNQSIFINGRYIKNKTLTVAVENAFKSFATVNKFPFFVLFIEVFPEFVDVNIHPTKSEVKFRDERYLFKNIFAAVHTALKNDVFNDFKIPEEEISNKNIVEEELIAFNIPEDNSIVFNSFEKNKQLNEFKIEESSLINDTTLLNEINKTNSELAKLKEKVKLNPPPKNIISPNASSDMKYIYVDSSKKDSALNDNILFEKFEDVKSKTTSEELVNIQNTNKEKIAKFPPLRIIGQFNKTYILGEFNHTLYLIDQHAAHEKIYFEKYLKDIKEGSIIVQPLLVPTLIEMTTDDLAYYDENKNVFTESGFLIESFGGNTLALKEVPYFLGKIDAKRLFLNIIDNLKNLGSGKREEVKYNKIASMACKSAVKGNDSLSEMEMIKLVEELRFIEDPFHCPHGRPTIIKFTDIDLDKKFKRII
ncbi:MAG: DNA mismatch repair endonuclease MutL [Clostridium sp.]|uniref:DNA mismatch repair endonuclease MutL n=1 Tax=Clostridium sp. TaxID=1506 RepID=UPI003F2CF0BC